MVHSPVNPRDRIRCCAGRIGTSGEYYPVIPERSERIQSLCPLRTHNLLQILVRLLFPVDERALNRHRDTVILADLDSFFCREAVVDNAMPVIGSRVIIKSSLDAPRCLIERLVSDSVHFNLKTCTVRRLAEVRDFLIRVVEDALPADLVHVRFVHRSVMGAEAAVQCTFKASADTREVTACRHFHIH